MSFKVGAHAKYPMNYRYCAGCRAFKSNKGCQIKPRFVCLECKNKAATKTAP